MESTDLPLAVCSRERLDGTLRNGGTFLHDETDMTNSLSKLGLALIVLITSALTIYSLTKSTLNADADVTPAFEQAKRTVSDGEVPPRLEHLRKIREKYDF